MPQRLQKKTDLRPIHILIATLSATTICFNVCRVRYIWRNNKSKTYFPLFHTMQRTPIQTTQNFQSAQLIYQNLDEKTNRTPFCSFSMHELIEWGKNRCVSQMPTNEGTLFYVQVKLHIKPDDFGPPHTHSYRTALFSHFIANRSNLLDFLFAVSFVRSARKCCGKCK